MMKGVRMLYRDCAIGVLLVLALVAPARAELVGGDILVTPTRLVIAGDARTAAITVINTGTKTVTYRVAFVHMRMDEYGNMKEVTDVQPGEFYADALVRFAPHQLVLKPNSTQIIRLQVRKPAQLAAGEYRAHLVIRALPPDPDNGEQADTVNPAKGLKIQLTALFGTAIPIFVLHGNTSATVTLTDLTVQPGEKLADPPLLSARFNRTGNQSVYGDITVTFTPNTPKNAKAVLLNEIHGLAVYSPNPTRLVRLPLHLPAGMALRGGRLTLTYRVKPEDGGKLLAESSLELP